MTTATRYITEPTDRSTPRTSSTKVMPIAITATWVDCVRMFRKLASERKRSESTPKARHRTANSINGASRSRIKTRVRESNRLKARSSIPQRRRHKRFAIEVRPLEEATHLAATHDHDAVGHTDQFLDLGGDEEDCRAVGDHLVDDLIDFIFCSDVDPPRRFVEDKDR